MTQSDIEKIIAQGEGISIEFKKAKEKVPQSLYETVVSFANTRGGYILLGVDDDGTVLGIQPESKADFLKNIATALNSKDNINPVMYLNPTPVEYQDKTIIAIQVPASSQVHDHTGRIYIREYETDLDNKWLPKLTESLKNIEIDGQLQKMDWNGQISYLVPSWIEKITKSNKKVTKSKEDNSIDNQSNNKNDSLSQVEKVTKLPNKRLQYLIAILLLSGDSITIDEYVDVFAFRDRSFFRRSYINPLETAGFIQKTNPDKPTASNQKYLITEKGKRFLTGRDFLEQLYQISFNFFMIPHTFFGSIR
jgi:predicted HTH transcriptional regulator